MTRSLSTLLAVMLLACAIVFGGAACGGGGGGGGGSDSTGGNNQPTGDLYLPSQQIVGTAPGSTVSRSLANLEIGDTVDVRCLAYYIGANGLYSDGAYQSVSAVSVSAPGVATLSGNRLTAVGAGSGSISLTANGVVLNGTITVGSNLGSIAGRVRTVDNGVDEPGVAEAVVKFYDAGGNVVASVTTGPDGRYFAHVPEGTTQFAVDLGVNYTNSFYNQFQFGTKVYSAEVTPVCGVGLSGVTSATNATLDDAIATAKSSATSSQNPPPPPVTGCNG